MAAGMEPIPGTADIWEPEVVDWVELESAARDVFGRYAYSELRTPIFERTDVFIKAIGDDTEVVQKEMYTFDDRGGRSLTLRPEGTAGVMRAVGNRGLSQGEELRVFYMGAMFRGERPAAGRRRQFHQIGSEAVGSCSPLLDAECMAMLMHYLERVGIEGARLQINTRGLPEDREQVSSRLRAFLDPLIGDLCDDCRRRLAVNVWRILDCKNPQCQATIERAPNMLDMVGDESRAFFAAVCSALDGIGLEYEIVPRLVRGLDYYVHTVFEVVHAGLGAQDALAGGGRYRIVPAGASKALEGVGFAAGMERLLMARESLGIKAAAGTAAQVYVAGIGPNAGAPGMALAQDLRAVGIRALAETNGRSMKAQMRSANRLGVRVTLILGDAELANGTVVCRDMSASEQFTMPVAEVPGWVADRLRTAVPPHA